MSNFRNLKVSFANINPLNVFPATGFEIVKKSYDTIINFYCENEEENPISVATIVLSNFSLKEFILRGNEVIKAANFSKGNIEQYENLKMKNNDNIRRTGNVILPKRINASIMASMMDTVNICCGYIHPFLINPESKEDEVANFLVPTLIDVSMTQELFSYLILTLEDEK